MTLMEDPLVGREPVSASCNRWTNEGLETEKYGVYPKEHPANCPLRWRLGNDMGVYLSWLQVGLGHHTRTPNRWSVHQRCFTTSCSPFRQPPLATRPVFMIDNTRPHRSKAVTAYLQSEAVISLPWLSMSPDLNPIEHVWDMLDRRVQAVELPVQNVVNWSSNASVMAAATTEAHPTTDWRDETEGLGRHPNAWLFRSILNFQPWMSLSDSKLTFFRWNGNLIVHYELWRLILKMDILVYKLALWLCDNLSIKLSFLLILVVFS